MEARQARFIDARNHLEILANGITFNRVQARELIERYLGQVGCCASSPMRHARAHAATTGHVIVRSIEPGENWRWCYVDEQFV